MSRTEKRVKARRIPVQERSRFTGDVILEAAIRIFSKESLATATTIKIAEKAGVSVGSLYEYFPNKETLFLRVVEKRIERGTQRVIAALAEKRGQVVEDPDVVSLLLPIYVNLYREDISIFQSAMRIFPNLMAVVKVVVDSDSKVASYLGAMPHYLENISTNRAVMAAVLVKSIHAAARCVAASAETNDDLQTYIHGALQVYGITGSRAERAIRRAKREGLKDHFLSIISYMGEQHRVTISDLENLLGINRRSLQRNLRILVDRGFVWEVGSSPTDPMKFYELL